MNHAPTAHATTNQAFVHCEIFVQTARLFCVRIFLVANKPSISLFVKNQQTSDNQPLTRYTTLLARQQPPQSIAFTR